MKTKIIKSLLPLCLLVFLSTSVKAQLANNGVSSDGATSTSSFINASGLLFSSSNGFTADGTGNVGKGMVFPRTDLTQFVFTTLLSQDFPTLADGMIVYNNAQGTTPASGSGKGNQTVVPGFYYFSNPGSQFNTSNGQWLPIGGADSSSKSIELTGTADGINTLLDLGTATIAANSVTRFISARVYLADDLVMEASVDYDKATNIFVTGNGALNTLLPAGTYTVVLEYQ